jgi:hypothetical protein
MHTVSGRYGVIDRRRRHLGDVHCMHRWHVLKCESDGVRGMSDWRVVTTLLDEFLRVYGVRGWYLPRLTRSAIVYELCLRCMVTTFVNILFRVYRLYGGNIPRHVDRTVLLELRRRFVVASFVRRCWLVYGMHGRHLPRHVDSAIVLQLHIRCVVATLLTRLEFVYGVFGRHIPRHAHRTVLLQLRRRCMVTSFVGRRQLVYRLYGRYIPRHHCIAVVYAVSIRLVVTAVTGRCMLHVLRRHLPPDADVAVVHAVLRWLILTRGEHCVYQLYGRPDEWCREYERHRVCVLRRRYVQPYRGRECMHGVCRWCLVTQQCNLVYGVHARYVPCHLHLAVVYELCHG